MILYNISNPFQLVTKSTFKGCQGDTRFHTCPFSSAYSHLLFLPMTTVAIRPFRLIQYRALSQNGTVGNLMGGNRPRSNLTNASAQ